MEEKDNQADKSTGEIKVPPVVAQPADAQLQIEVEPAVPDTADAALKNEGTAPRNTPGPAAATLSAVSTATGASPGAGADLGRTGETSENESADVDGETGGEEEGEEAADVAAKTKAATDGDGGGGGKGGQKAGGGDDGSMDNTPFWIFGMSRRDWGFLLGVLIAGMVGAWCAKVVGKDIMVFEHGKLYATPIGMWSVGFIGAISAGLGVYLLANSNTADRARTLFFAVACGLCSQIIIAKTISTIEDSMGMRGRSLKADEVFEEFKRNLAVGGAAVPGVKAGEIHDWMVTFIERARVAEGDGDPALAASNQQHAIDLLNGMMQRLDTDPLPVVEEVGRIMRWARQRNLGHLKDAGLAALENATIREDAADYLEAAAIRDSIVGEFKPSGDGKDEDAGSTAARSDAAGEGEMELCFAGDAGAGAPTVFGGRIYLETDKEGMETAMEIVKKLRSLANYSVIAPRVPDNPDAGECRVLYYREDDKVGAEALYEILKEFVPAGVTDARKGTRQVRGVSGARPKHFDLRIGRDVLKKIKEKVDAAAAAEAPAPAPPQAI